MLLADTPELVRRRDATVLTVSDRHAVLVELNLAGRAGVTAATGRFLALFAGTFAREQVNAPPVPERVSAYQRCWLTREEIKALLQADTQDANGADVPPQELAIFRIWPDYVLTPHLDRSVRTVNADAAARVYGASGRGIVWAVVDSGIDATHPHFAGGTLTDAAVNDLHRDFTDLVQGVSTVSQIPPAEPSTTAEEPAGSVTPDSGQHDGRGQRAPTADPTALTDPVGHGTHVAAIIAGQLPASVRAGIATSVPTAEELPQWRTRELADRDGLSGVAPEALLVSLRVLLPTEGETPSRHPVR